jgi:hypothetical protein
MRPFWRDIPDCTYAADRSILPWESCFTDPVDGLVVCLGADE